jgi:hypothetical protein
MLLEEGMRMGKDEYRKEMEPSTKPLLESVYDVAKPGADNDEMRRRRP